MICAVAQMDRGFKGALTIARAIPQPLSLFFSLSLSRASERTRSDESRRAFRRRLLANGTLKRAGPRARFDNTVTRCAPRRGVHPATGEPGNLSRVR